MREEHARARVKTLPKNEIRSRFMLAGISGQIQIDTFRADIRVFLMETLPRTGRFLGPVRFPCRNF